MIVQALAPKAVNVLFREPGMTTERLAQLGVRRASVGSGQGHLAGVRRGHLTTCVTGVAARGAVPTASRGHAQTVHELAPKRGAPQKPPERRPNTDYLWRAGIT